MNYPVGYDKLLVVIFFVIYILLVIGVLALIIMAARWGVTWISKRIAKEVADEMEQRNKRTKE